ncbi:MAG: helix-turn-helix domain-containing protein [Chloroflexi bacterium]|nr:helix-turn-helix domain-containing protein [Chloroflexota bacterium]
METGKGNDRQPTSGDGAERGRFTTRHKQELVLRLVRGEPLETVSRDVGVTAATLAAWCNQLLSSGAAALKRRHPAPATEGTGRLQAKISELTMANELLQGKITRLYRSAHGNSIFVLRSVGAVRESPLRWPGHPVWASV